MSQTMRIGIYSGTFDPVHAGHVSFALQAMEAANLDKVYFLPERRPRNKQGIEHFGHRVAMLNRACRPHNKLGVLELEDLTLSVERTLPRLKKHFPGAQLVFLMGSDIVATVPSWSNARQLLKYCELAVGVRAQDQQLIIKRLIKDWEIQPKELTIIKSFAAEVSSRTIRAALRERRYTRGLLTSVTRYSDSHWLYISLAQVLQKTQ